MTSRRTSESYAGQVIALECRTIDNKAGARPALRVCDKLRLPLNILVGAVGYRSLLTRALMLAKSETSWFDGSTVDAGGSITPSAEAAATLESAEGAQAGAAVVAHLIGLLISIIGESLTVRLLQDIWPKTAFKS